MQSSIETVNLPRELQSTLAVLMKGATFSEEVLHDMCLPVVMMLRQHALTAFAVGDQADYQLLYEAFKKHYVKNTAQWSMKDIAFVYCLPPSVTVDPDFCSRVEVDVYFCRKYVIRLDENLAESFARLPFLPLSPITPGVQTRPPSAQTLLQQRNLKADLAKALVVPSTSSASTILTSCLAGTYGTPDALQSPTGPRTITDVGEIRAQATLKSIAIENFRAYRTKKVFELGSAVTILYGPNGFGKTSFFDAIDFAVTGGVGRLAKAPGGLTRVAKHLDSQGDPTEVTLTIEREGETHVITRNLADHNNALVDGKVTSRKEVFSLLTGGTAPGTDRVDSLVDLFRATHLFSQENQELTQYVASKCELSSELVSRMLAFEDYASGLKKAEEVLRLATQEYSKATTDVANARQAIENESKELERLEGLAASDTSSEALDARFAGIEEATTTAGFDISGFASRDTRGMRAMLDAAAAEAVARRAVLSHAIEQVGTLGALRGQLEPMLAQLTERRGQLEQAEAHEKEASERLAALSSQLAKLKAEEQGLRLRRDWLTWAVSVKPEYDQLTSQGQSLAAGLTALSSQLNQQRVPVEKAQVAQREAAASLQRAEAAVKAASEKRVRFLEVKDTVAAWEQAEPTFVALQTAEVQIQASIDELRRQESEFQAAERAQELLVANSERELAEVRSSDSRLKKLISELRDHVDGPNCQLCGYDHGSTERLLAAIDLRMQRGDRVIQLTETAANQRAVLQTLVGQRQALAERLKQEQLRKTQTQMQRSQLEQQRASVEALLSSIMISLTSDTPQQMQNLTVQVHEDELNAAGRVGSARQELQTAEVALASAQAGYQAFDDQRQASEAAQSDIQKRLTELLNKASQGSINLASSLQMLTDAERVTEEQRAATSAAAQSANEQVDGQRVGQAAAKAAVTAARTSHQQANQAWTGHQARVEAVLSELTAAKFDSGVSQEQLRQQVEIAAEREALALGLRDRVAELEVAVDTAATSAAFESIRQRIFANEAVIQEATAHVQSVQPWIGYFTEVKKLLSTQQAYATEHFISQYGPRTAVIQQRLRPVYGFGEIEITSKDSAIDIRIHRKGETLRPTDFFSQSQVQTLVLGLFLTACSSQTWSGFSSIMMDDPVTHFDDLNTYALLDLILGLQSSPEGERQFVISTCDEKLLQLARHKFRHMGVAARFYRFQAIGAEGPMVSEISA
ncbi:AAA family ATPase [Duganella sp. HH105]|uniref:AAA family ATPase n=1 Tax=Duganella sp. HH105 TaxID=1781067 RepID=UPI000877CA5E|nr:AAA family ATPase [Duganella sp. HH105]OEZ54224.1 chromosome partition protein Smc [Duganella sp. HH105]